MEFDLSERRRYQMTNIIIVVIKDKEILVHIPK